MQPLGLVWESKAKHFSMCSAEWKKCPPQAPGPALAMAAQELFSLVCCKLLLALGSFFTRKPVSSTALHSRLLQPLLIHGLYQSQILGFALDFCWISLGFSRLYTHLWMVTLFLLHTNCSPELIIIIQFAEPVLSLSGCQSEIKGIGSGTDPRVKQSYCDHHTSSLMTQLSNLELTSSSVKVLWETTSKSLVKSKYTTSTSLPLPTEPFIVP